MQKNKFTSIGEKVTFMGKVGIVKKALDYKTVIHFENEPTWTHIRHENVNMGLLKPFVTDKGVNEKRRAVDKAVSVLNAPRGTVNEKQMFITKKLESEGFSNAQATTIFLEALNIAGHGALLASV